MTPSLLIATKRARKNNTHKPMSSRSHGDEQMTGFPPNSKICPNI